MLGRFFRRYGFPGRLAWTALRTLTVALACLKIGEVYPPDWLWVGLAGALILLLAPKGGE